MNGNALVRILATFGLLIASLWIAFDIFTSGSNAVARFYMYTLIVAGIYGLLNARKAFYVLIFLTGYLDFFKRFMIFDSGVQRMDLYYVLGIAPATMAGIMGNILYQHFTGRLPGRPGLNRLITLTLLATAFVLALAMSRGGGFRSVGDAVNTAIYIPLLFVVPVLFRTPEQLRSLLKILVICYVPSVGYMLVHYFKGGVFAWEMDYLKSGLTIEIRQLQERVFRPFGTMNAASNASMVYAVIIAVCCSALWRAPSTSGRSNLFLLRWAFVPVIALAMYATYSRSGWVFAVVAIIAAPMLRSRMATLLGYAAAGTAFIAVILASPYLLKHKILNEISGEIYAEKRTDQWAQTTNLSTLNDRLEGFYGLVTTPDVWTPFGLKMSSVNESSVRNRVATHDMISDILMQYGFVTIIAGAVIIALQLRKLHALIINEPEPLARAVAATGLAIGLSLTSGGSVNGPQFMTYPVNFFIWFCYSIVVSIWMYTKERELDEKAAEAPKEAAPWLRTGLVTGGSRPPGMPVPAHAKA